MPFHILRLRRASDGRILVVLDKDETLHAYLLYFAMWMEPHMTALEIVVRDYYLHGNSSRHFFCTVLGMTEAEYRLLELRIFAEVNEIFVARLHADPELNAELFALKELGCVFGKITQNTRANTQWVLSRLGLEDLFTPELVFTKDELGGQLKEGGAPYLLFEQRAGALGLGHLPRLMADDHPRYLWVPHRRGWQAVQIGKAPHVPADHPWPQFATLTDAARSLRQMLENSLLPA